MRNYSHPPIAGNISRAFDTVARIPSTGRSSSMSAPFYELVLFGRRHKSQQSDGIAVSVLERWNSQFLKVSGKGPPDLARVVESLASAVQDAVTALYDLQAAVANMVAGGKGSNTLLDQVKKSSDSGCSWCHTD
jgi:hypothetical protein